MIAVGRLKPGPEKTIAGEYLTRAEGLGRKCGITRIGVTEFAGIAGLLARRAHGGGRKARLRRPCRAKSFSVVLDERGKALASEAFAELLRRHLDGGTPDMAFLIGGPDGHAPGIREHAGLLMSFGPMTWPHRLVRVMLFEQLYRAVTIIAGHPYHRA